MTAALFMIPHSNFLSQSHRTAETGGVCRAWQWASSPPADRVAQPLGTVFTSRSRATGQPCESTRTPGYGCHRASSARQDAPRDGCSAMIRPESVWPYPPIRHRATQRPTGPTSHCFSALLLALVAAARRTPRTVERSQLWSRFLAFVLDQPDR